MKKFLPIIAIVALFVGYFLFNSTNNTPTVVDSEAQLILFWGTGCPHCETVKEYIKDNNLESKIKVSYKEVYYDNSNKQLLEETVKKCPEIDSSRGIGVPLAFDTEGNKCLYGDTPIIEWLSTK